MTLSEFKGLCRRAIVSAATLGALPFLWFSSASSAPAELKGVSVSPAAPTQCDAISIVVTGELPNSCYEITRFAFHVDSIPCMDPITGSPIPCPARVQVDVVVREPSPASTCLGVIAPYTRTAEVGRLPVGRYVVNVHEIVVPYYALKDSIVSESFLSTTFEVRADLTCVPELGCYLLSFHDPRLTPDPGAFCDATALPGGTACLNLTMMNTRPVGGLQTLILATAADESTRADAFLHPVSVEAVGRAAGFQVGWTAEGSQARIILYSPSGATIPEGQGPVLRICYSVAPETPSQTFVVRDIDTIVADPTGNALPVCPTFARVAPGRICVAAPAPSCDLNGDGVSDVLDIIRLVRCALASTTDSTSACPDSIAARADCNGDGSVNILDVICCVRKIVGLSRPGGTPSEIGMPGGSSINFDGPIIWTSATEGVATIRADVPQDWGGVEFSVDPGEAPVWIQSLSLGAAPSGATLESAVDASGVAHAIVYDVASGAPAGSIGITVHLTRTSSGTGSTIRLVDLKSGSASGEATHVSSYAPELSMEGSPIPAPMLFKARPNPFAGQTEIAFVLPVDARTSLKIYDVRGRLVRSLVQGPTTAGVHRIQWNGADDRGKAARSGIYFAKLIVGSSSRTERIMLLR